MRNQQRILMTIEGSRRPDA